MGVHTHDDNLPGWELDLIADAVDHQVSERLERFRARDRLDSPDRWLASAHELLEIELDANEAYARAYCCLAVEVADAAARERLATAERAQSQVDQAWQRLTSALRQLDPDELEAAARSRHSATLPRLQMLRDELSLLPRTHDPAVHSLELEMLDGWAAVYRAARARVRTVRLTIGDRTEELSLGALSQRRTDPDETVRRLAYQAELDAWSDESELCALAARGIASVRRHRAQRAQQDPVAWTLVDNRVSTAVMDALFEGIDDARRALVRYFEAKARWFGKPRLDWWDLRAPPVDEDGDLEPGWSGVRSDLEQALRGAGHGMARFAKQAFDRRWIDVGVRPGRQQGGFCAHFGRSGESRLFLSFVRPLEARVVLAHELGHAFHFHMLGSAPAGEREVPPILLEAASLVAEHLMVCHLVEHTSERTRLCLLDQQIQAGWRLLMDAPARFTLERAMYEDAGITETADALSSWCEREQAASFGDALGSYSPLLWASSPLLFEADKPFQNWHYTLGYVFSQALVTRFGDHLAGFDLPAFLRESGRVPPVELARRYLDADLTDADFWRGACQPLIRHIDEFVAHAARAHP